MTTEKAFEHLKLAALEVKGALIDIDENIHPSVNEVENLCQIVNNLQEQLIIYKYLKTQKELSPSLNIHLKVMEQTQPKEEAVPVANDLPIAESKEEVKTEVKPTEPIQPQAKTVKRIELGLNDKFRIINELFAQNSTEFNLAIDQLNTIDSFEKSEIYLTELMNLYKWKKENELTQRLFQLNQKRFA